jgi:hypothetical protein
LERDLEDPLDLERDALDFDRDEPDRLLPPLDRLLPERDEVDRGRDELDLARDELDLARDELDLARDELDLAREEPDRLLPPLDALERERELLELRELLEERRRDVPPLRSAAGISSRATAFASCAICFSRNFAMRSSSRRIALASFAVSLSPTVSASASIAVYWPISWNSFESSVRAFFHIFSDSPVPRSAWRGP